MSKMEMHSLLLAIPLACNQTGPSYSAVYKKQKPTSLLFLTAIGNLKTPHCVDYFRCLVPSSNQDQIWSSKHPCL